MTLSVPEVNTVDMPLPSVTSEWPLIPLITLLPLPAITVSYIPEFGSDALAGANTIEELPSPRETESFIAGQADRLVTT